MNLEEIYSQILKALGPFAGARWFGDNHNGMQCMKFAHPNIRLVIDTEDWHYVSLSGRMEYGPLDTLDIVKITEWIKQDVSSL